MSGNSDSASEADGSYLPRPNLTDLALGRGLKSQGTVGMSSPLPDPPTEMGAASVGHAHTAKPDAQRTQPKGLSVSVDTEKRNTSSPPDTVRSPPHNRNELDPGHEHYGAWFSTIITRPDLDIISDASDEAVKGNHLWQ